MIQRKFDELTETEMALHFSTSDPILTKDKSMDIHLKESCEKRTSRCDVYQVNFNDLRRQVAEMPKKRV